MQHLVFVYGSLKQGFHNHPFVQNSEFLGAYVSKENYVLTAGPGFPYLLKPHQAATLEALTILGELYSVSDTTFAELDKLERNGTFYQREEIELRPRKKGNSNSQVAWAYFLMENQEDLDVGSSFELVQMKGGKLFYGW